MSGSLNVVPTFVAPDGSAHADVLQAARTVRGPAELDVVSVASMLSFQYVVDGRSILSRVSRRSWLADVAEHDEGLDAVLRSTYGRRLTTRRTAARELLCRLRAELERAFACAERVTVLLSGGLDSRVAAAVLADLARAGKVSDDLRAVTWGIPESRDRNFGARVAQLLHMEWEPIDLGPANLLTNVDVAAGALGALVSPVHLHAVTALAALDWSPHDAILVSSLGNGIGRGTYLWRHVSYARPLEPADWLGLMRPDVAASAFAALAEDIAQFRRRLGSCPAIAVHECEMLAHYVSGQLLPVYGFLARVAAPVHQALSDPSTYRYLWSLSPLLRTGALYRSMLGMCRPELADIPYALTNRPVRRLGRSERNGLSPFVHRYPRWIVHDLAEPLDHALSSDWWDATGTFDGAAVWRAWQAVRHHPEPHPQTTYVLLWLWAARRLMEKLEVTRCDNAGDRPSAAMGGRSFGTLPWGFAGRPPDPAWNRLMSLPRQAIDIARCHGHSTSDSKGCGTASASARLPG